VNRQQYELLSLVKDGRVRGLPRQVLFVVDGEPLAPPLQRMMVTLTGIGMVLDPPDAASNGWTPGLTAAGEAALAGAAPGPRATLRADGLYCSAHGNIVPMPADGTLNLNRADKAWQAHLVAVHGDPPPTANQARALRQVAGGQR
jgi:hypothetical protein